MSSNEKGGMGTPLLQLGGWDCMSRTVASDCSPMGDFPVPPTSTQRALAPLFTHCLLLTWTTSDDDSSSGLPFLFFPTPPRFVWYLLFLQLRMLTTAHAPLFFSSLGWHRCHPDPRGAFQGRTPAVSREGLSGQRLSAS